MIAAYKTQNPKGTVIGFAAETDDLEMHAKQKLIQKNMAAICANWVGDDKAFGKTDNALTVFFSADIKPVELPLAPKQTLAFSLWHALMPLFATTDSKQSTTDVCEAM